MWVYDCPRILGRGLGGQKKSQMIDYLDDLCDEINQQWNEDIERITEAICNRFDMMEMEARHGEEKQGQGDCVRENGMQNFEITLPKYQPESKTVPKK